MDGVRQVVSPAEVFLLITLPMPSDIISNTLSQVELELLMRILIRLRKSKTYNSDQVIFSWFEPDTPNGTIMRHTKKD